MKSPIPLTLIAILALVPAVSGGVPGTATGTGVMAYNNYGLDLYIDCRLDVTFVVTHVNGNTYSVDFTYQAILFELCPGLEVLLPTTISFPNADRAGNTYTAFQPWGCGTQELELSDTGLNPGEYWFHVDVWSTSCYENVRTGFTGFVV